MTIRLCDGEEISAQKTYYSRSDHALIRTYDAAYNVIETHEHKGDFKEW
jgi:hypothetical protein